MRGYRAQRGNARRSLGDHGATRPSDVHPRPKKTVRVHGAGTESIHAWRGSTIDPLQYGPANDPRRKKSRRSTPCVDTARSAATPAEAAWPRRNQPVRRSTPAEEDRPGSWRRNGEHPRVAWIYDGIRVHTAPPMTRDVKNPVDPRHAWIPRAARQRPPKPGRPRRNHTVRRSPQAEEDRPGSWRRNGEHPRMAWIYDWMRLHTARTKARDVPP